VVTAVPVDVRPLRAGDRSAGRGRDGVVRRGTARDNETREHVMDETRPPTGANTGRSKRDGKGRYTRTQDSAERDANAARLRADGANYDEIAREMGYGSAASAWKAVDRALRATVAEPAARVRTIELARLDILLWEAWKVLRARHIVVNQGRVVLDPDSGQPLHDHGPVLQAIDRVLKIQERRARLLGLDAPVKVEAITVDQIEAEIARLAAELGMNDPRPLVEP